MEGKSTPSGFSHKCEVAADNIVNDFLCTNGHEEISAFDGNKFRKVLLWSNVFPPSPSGSFLELTVVANCTILFTAAGLRGRLSTGEVDSALQLPKLVCSALNRVLQYCGHSGHMPGVPSCGDVEDIMMMFTSLVEDPLYHFKLLPVLGRLLLLSSVWCLYKRLDAPDSGALAKAITSLVKLRSLVEEAVLKEPLPQKGGLTLSCKAADVGTVDVTCPCVQDVVDMVLTALGTSHSGYAVTFDDWRWLFSVFECEQLIQHQQHVLALSKLQTALSLPLDPEKKSQLLCVLAKCYFSQGYSQLAIQSYKAALEADHGNLTIFLHLANIYSTLELSDLELECLRILTQRVSERESRISSTQPMVTEFDNVVAAVVKAVPSVSFVQAVHHYGKRCFQLQRCKEAATQYLNLLRYIQDPDKVCGGPSDQGQSMKPLVVEASEALVMAGRHEECVTLCEELIPCFLAGDASIEDSRNMELIKERHRAGQSRQLSEDNLFSSPESSGCLDPAVGFISKTGSQQNHAFLPSSGDRTLDPIVTPSTLQRLCGNPRKRRRSSSSDDGDLFSSEADSGEREDSSPDNCLTVRLLVCKSDCLVALHGYTEDAMKCLLRAHNLLLDSRPNETSTETSAPLRHSSKRQKTDVEDYNVMECRESTELSDISAVDGWTRLMIQVGLRMGKISLKRKVFASVLNSCHLVLQMDSGSVPAHYMATLVVKERQDQGVKAATDWLKLRGVGIDGEAKALEAAISMTENKLMEVQSKQKTETVQWWLPSDVHLLSLDLACLQLLLSHT